MTCMSLRGVPRALRINQCIANLPESLAVKEFRKSVNNRAIAMSLVSLFYDTIRYDTIPEAILTCSHKLHKLS